MNTRFHVGSLTKSLLATGGLRLVTEGLIELDAPASRYLPDLSFDNSWNGSSLRAAVVRGTLCGKNVALEALGLRRR